MKRKCLVLQHEKVDDNFWFVKIQVSCEFAQENHKHLFVIYRTETQI